MKSDQIGEEYRKTTNDRVKLEIAISKLIENFTKGKSVYNKEQLIQVVNSGKERLAELKKIEAKLEQRYQEHKKMEEAKLESDVSVSSYLGVRPTDLKITRVITETNDKGTHTIVEKKSYAELEIEKQKLKEQLKEKVANGEINIEQASKIDGDLDKSYDYYKNINELKEDGEKQR